MVDAVFDFDSLDAVKFTRLTFSHLMEIARDSSDSRRTWLKSFLEANSDIRRLDGVKKVFESSTMK